MDNLQSVLYSNIGRCLGLDLKKEVNFILSCLNKFFFATFPVSFLCCEAYSLYSVNLSLKNMFLYRWLIENIA